MKPLLKQYLLMWLKYIVMLPALAASTLCCFVNSALCLTCSVLLADGKTFEGIMSDMIDRMQP